MSCQVDDGKNESLLSGTTRVTKTRSRSTLKNFKRMCFICNEQRESDNSSYNCGGLGRCESENSKTKLHERMTLYLQDKNHKFHDAATRLQMKISFEAHDFYAADVYYHNSCFIKFAVKKITTLPLNEKAEILQNDILDEFFLALKKCVIHEKEAFLLSDLLEDIRCLSEENGLDEPVITNTRSLKRHIIERFPDDISYYPKGKYLIVHCSDMNPCEYAVAVLKGKGLKSNDIIRSFGTLIRRKIKERLQEEKEIEWPYSPEELVRMLDKGPLPELYNAIYYTVNGNFKLNKYGYAETPSSNLATKLWAMACDWENLLSKEKSAKQLITGLTVHRLTGRKDVIQMLHKLNTCASYNDIRLQNKSWARMVSASKRISNHMIKKVPVHATIDNNDGVQETLTGKGTTHDTNMTLFQPLCTGLLLFTLVSES